MLAGVSGVRTGGVPGGGVCRPHGPAHMFLRGMFAVYLVRLIGGGGSLSSRERAGWGPGAQRSAGRVVSPWWSQLPGTTCLTVHTCLASL